MGIKVRDRGPLGCPYEFLVGIVGAIPRKGRLACAAAGQLGHERRSRMLHSEFPRPGGLGRVESWFGTADGSMG